MCFDVAQEQYAVFGDKMEEKRAYHKSHFRSMSISRKLLSQRDIIYRHRTLQCFASLVSLTCGLEI